MKWMQRYFSKTKYESRIFHLECLSLAFSSFVPFFLLFESYFIFYSHISFPHVFSSSRVLAHWPCLLHDVHLAALPLLTETSEQGFFFFLLESAKSSNVKGMNASHDICLRINQKKWSSRKTICRKKEKENILTLLHVLNLQRAQMDDARWLCTAAFIYSNFVFALFKL